MQSLQQDFHSSILEQDSTQVVCSVSGGRQLYESRSFYTSDTCKICGGNDYVYCEYTLKYNDITLFRCRAHYVCAVLAGGWDVISEEMYSSEVLTSIEKFKTTHNL